MLLVKLALSHPDAPDAGGEPVTLTVTTSLDYLRSQTRPEAAPPPPEAAPPPPAAGRDVDQPGTGATRARPGREQQPAPDRGNWCAPGVGTSTRTGSGRTGSAGEPVLEPATLEDGTPLSPETTRLLACDAWLVLAIHETAEHPEILDIGRLSRTPTRALRRAVVLRDKGCAFPGCGRPPRWCHAHHIWHWALGGPTCLDNLVLLCAHHHRAIHHGGWAVRIGPHGRPVFTPPRWVDPDQHPRAAWQPPTLSPTPLRR
jgi:hypothetical protein